jgi:hypothetical protein
VCWLRISLTKSCISELPKDVKHYEPPKLSTPAASDGESTVVGQEATQAARIPDIGC